MTYLSDFFGHLTKALGLAFAFAFGLGPDLKAVK